MLLNEKEKEKNQKEYFCLINEIFKNDFQIVRNNFIIITGVNGIGKSYLLNKIKNNNVLFITKKTRNEQKDNSLIIVDREKNIFEEEFDLLKLDFKDKENLKNVFKKIIDNYISIWLDYFEKDLDNPFPSVKNLNEFTNLKHKDKIINLNDYTGKIVDLNKLIKSSKNNNFNDLLLKFKESCSSYIQLNIKQDLNNDSKNNKNSKVIKMIDLLDDYLENKKVLGLNDELEKIQFVDLNNSNEDKKELEINNLSEGEKILFALASEFLETKQKNKIYIWDEMENHLHPQWQSKILSFIKEAIDDSIFIGSTHSQVIIPQAFIYKDISLLKLSREKGKIILSETNLKEDQDLKNAFNLNLDFFDKLKNIVNDTIFVEGKSDKIYLEKFLENVNVTDFGGGRKNIKILESMKYINHISGNVLFLLDNDNDDQEFKTKIEKKEFFIAKERIHFLKGLKYGNSIEYYFKDLFKNNEKIQINNKTYQIIKDFDKFWEENKNWFENVIKEKNKNQKQEIIKIELENEKQRIKNQIDKSGFLFSYSSKVVNLNQKFIYNQKEILLISKVDFANYLIQNREKEVKEKLTPLLVSLKESLKK